jgi:hypothetical protein
MARGKKTLRAMCEAGTFERTTAHDYRFVIICGGKTRERVLIERAAYLTHWQSEARRGEEKAAYAIEQMKDWDASTEKRIADEEAAPLGALAWSGDEKNAAKAADKGRACGFRNVQIVPVTHVYEGGKWLPLVDGSLQDRLNALVSQ